jgi:hypothetical protein
VAGTGRQADEGELQTDDPIEQPLRQRQPLAQGRLDVLADGERAEQRPVLEQHALTRLQRPTGALAQAIELLAEHLDPPALGPLQTEEDPQQHGFAGAGAAHDAEHLAAPDLEVETVVNHLRAKAGAQALNEDGGRSGHAGHTPR